MLLIPLLGAVVVWFFPKPRMARGIALGTTLAALLPALAILISFDASRSGFQSVESLPWIPTLNMGYLVGVDGISVLFLPLTLLLFLGVVVASWTRVRNMPRLYFSLLLLFETVTLGIFCALDTLLFFLFWELTLVPLYFLISLWGTGPNRRYAAVKYTLFMLAGGVPLLFGILVLAFNHAEILAAGRIPEGLSFSYLAFLETSIPGDTQTLVFFLLLAGFAIKIPVFPFHTWLPVTAQEGPIAIVSLLTGLKLGAYGVLRFVVPLAPEAARDFHWLLAGLGVAGVLYGGVLAINQTNLRPMLAFSSISHVGLVLLGIASFSHQGVQGALFLLLNFTVAAGGVFLLTGFLHHRTGSTDLLHLGGVAKRMPLLAGFFLLFGLASIAVPGTSGFPGEFLIIVSTIASHTGAALAALFAMVLGAGYFLSIYRRAFLGPIRSEVVSDAVDLLPRELFLTCILAFLVLIAGLFPDLVLDLSKSTAVEWVSRIQTR